MKYKNLSRVPIGRRASLTEPKKVFHVFCEGEKTEPNYLNAYIQHLGDVPYSLHIVAPVGVAKTVVAAAILAKKKIIDFDAVEDTALDASDEFWVVFDCDAEDRLYAEAKAQASAKGIGVACSNPCFELWLIMHFETCDVPDDHKALQQKVRNLCPGYHPIRNKAVDFGQLKGRVLDAENRAKQLRESREKDGSIRPETTFDLLTAALREASKPLRHGRPAELEGIKPFQRPATRHHKSSKPAAR